MNYEKMYHLLFNAITDALEQMEKQNLGSAKDLLTTAQQKTEEIYMESAASAAMLPRQAKAGLHKSEVAGNCVRLPNRRQSGSG